MQIRATRVEKVPGVYRKISQEKLLSLYSDPPQEEITLDEFELFALDRLQLLRGIESLKVKGYDGSEFNSKLSQLESKYLPLHTREAANVSSGGFVSAEQRKDQISHFILRLAYCRTEELRRWFLTHECALLKFRLERLSDVEQAEFMRINGIAYDQVSSEDKEKRKAELVNLSGVTEHNFYAMNLFRVPFTQCLGLLSTRSVYLEGGYCFVPLNRLVTTVVTRFRMMLSRSLVEAAAVFDRAVADTRIGPLLKNMNKQYVGSDFSKRQGSVDRLSADMVDAAAEVHMPLCMKSLHDILKRDHKLKHWGRLQYGLFLKGAGMELEEAMRYFENLFTRLITHDQFVKQYSYTFRHMYGKEGARKNYTPYSCMKIIMGAAPETGSGHGCPYRHMPDSQLAALLASLKLGHSEVQDIVRTAKSGNYQVACQKHFDITHPGHLSMNINTDGGSVANHPNLWFNVSMQYHKIKSGKSDSSSSAATASQETSMEVAAVEE